MITYMNTTQTAPQKTSKTTAKLSKLPAPIPPQKTNKYKYTEPFVSSELDSLLNILAAQEQIHTKVQLFSYKDYSTKKFSQWRNKYTTSKRITEKLQKIDEILESRLITSGFSIKNYAFVIFLLKNNYGYTDTKTIENDTTHTFYVSRGDIKPLKANKVVIPSVTTKPNVAQ